MGSPKGGKDAPATEALARHSPFRVASWLRSEMPQWPNLHSSVCSQQRVRSEDIGLLPSAFIKEPENLYFRPVSTQDGPNTPQQLSTYATICSFLIKLKKGRAGRFDGDSKELHALQWMG